MLLLTLFLAIANALAVSAPTELSHAKGRVDDSAITITAPSVYGCILLPSIGVRLAGTNYYLVHLKGRYSTSIRNRKLREIIDQTGMAALPTSTNEFFNFAYRVAYLMTFADAKIKKTVLEVRDYDGTLIRGTDLNEFSPPPCSNATVQDDGTFSCLTVIPYSGVNDIIWFNPRNAKIKNTVLLTEQEGFAIISDIDDTVKVTGVNNVKDMVKNGMFRMYTPVDGMPEYYWSLYNELGTHSAAEKLSSSRPTFHFLSASPMQLAPAIQPFLTDNYPPFELLMSTLSVASGGFKTIQKYEQFKVNSTHQIGSILQKKKFILIGDSTQKDPEAYGRITREFGEDRIACIFIRVVSGYNMRLEETLNTAQRFNSAFENVTTLKWSLFTDASQLPTPMQIKNGICRAPNVTAPIL